MTVASFMSLILPKILIDDAVHSLCHNSEQRKYCKVSYKSRRFYISNDSTYNVFSTAQMMLLYQYLNKSPTSLGGRGSLKNHT